MHDVHAPAGFTIKQNVATGLRNETAHLAQAKASTLDHVPGGEEGSNARASTSGGISEPVSATAAAWHRYGWRGVTLPGAR
jgi:hypothetical protein